MSAIPSQGARFIVSRKCSLSLVHCFATKLVFGRHIIYPYRQVKGGVGVGGIELGIVGGGGGGGGVCPNIEHVISVIYYEMAMHANVHPCCVAVASLIN